MPTNELVTTALSGPLSNPLSEDAHRLMEVSISQNTRKAYAAALDRLDSYLQSRPDPALTDETLANYLALLHEHGHPSQRANHQPRPLSPPSLALICQAVRFVERLQQRTTSVVGPMTERVLAGARREGKERGRGQVAAITREHLAVMVRDAERKDTLAGARDAALFRVMSDALLRISEAVHIDCEHITEEADGSGRLLVPTSKTDQEGKGAVLYLKSGTLNAIRAYQSRAGFMEGPLFRRMQKGDKIDPLRRLTAGRRAAGHQSGRPSRQHRRRVWPFVPHRHRPIAGRKGGRPRRFAKRGPVEVSRHARPLHPRTGRR